MLWHTFWFHPMHVMKLMYFFLSVVSSLPWSLQRVKGEDLLSLSIITHLNTAKERVFRCLSEIGLLWSRKWVIRATLEEGKGSSAEQERAPLWSNRETFQSAFLLLANENVFLLLKVKLSLKKKWEDSKTRDTHTTIIEVCVWSKSLYSFHKY